MPRLHQLVRPHDQLQRVVQVELSRWSRSEQPSHSSTAQHPVLDLVRVRPDQIPEASASGDLADPVDVFDVVEGLDVGGESAMEAEDIIWVRAGVLLTRAESGR